MLPTSRSFALLLLEEGEQYITDCAATLITSYPSVLPFNPPEAVTALTSKPKCTPEVHPIHQHTIHQHPIHQQTTHQHPIHRQTTHQHTAHQHPIHQHPIHRQTAHQHTTHQLTTHQHTTHQHPIHQHTTHQHTAHQHTAHQHTYRSTQPNIFDGLPTNEWLTSNHLLHRSSIPTPYLPYINTTPSIGCLRIASRGLLLEPECVALPIIKLPFKHMAALHVELKVDAPPILHLLSKQVIKIHTISIDGKTRCVSPYTSELADDKADPSYYSHVKMIYPKLPMPIQLNEDPSSTAHHLFDSRHKSSHSFNSVDTPKSGAPTDVVSLAYFYFFSIQLQSEAVNELMGDNRDKSVKPRNLSIGSPEYIAVVCSDLWRITTEQTSKHTSHSTRVKVDKYVNQLFIQLTNSMTFDISVLDHRELILLPHTKGVWVHQIKKLLKRKGFFQITDENIYFQPYPNIKNRRVKQLPLNDVVHVFKRVSAMKPHLLEFIATSSKRSQRFYKCFLIEFNDFETREEVAAIIDKTLSGAFEGQRSRVLLWHMATLWQRGKLSNFHYLDFLNNLSGRSRSNFSQYPVFPWVLNDYVNKTINLDDPNVYRDLTKPVGALDSKRLEALLQRMTEYQPDAAMNEDGTDPKGISPDRFIFGSHYSTPAHIVYWLVRKYPECQLRLHSGRFDGFSRMFHSVANAFNVACTGQSTFIELIPEFYETSVDFLTNRLTVQATEGLLNDVELPPWSDGSPERFLSIMRHALETDHVSRYLPDWIDLVFGYKQRGKESLTANNLFHPLTYADAAVAVSSRSCPIGLSPALSASTSRLLSDMSVDALQAQLEEFGQTPIQLFDCPHPKRLNCPKWKSPLWEGDPDRDAPWFIYLLRHPLIHPGLLPSKDSTLNVRQDSCHPLSPSYNLSTHPTDPPTPSPPYTTHPPMNEEPTVAAAPSTASTSWSLLWDGVTSNTNTTIHQTLRLSCTSLLNMCTHYDTAFFVDGVEGCLRVANPMKIFDSNNTMCSTSDAVWNRSIDKNEAATLQTQHPSTSNNIPVEAVRISESPLTSVAHIYDSDCVALGRFDGGIMVYAYQRQERDCCDSTFGRNGRIVLGDRVPSEQLKLCHADTVSCLVYERRQHVLVSGSSDQTVRLWSITPSDIQLTQVFDDQTDEITDVAVLPNLVLSGSRSGELFLWDTRSGSFPIWSANMSGVSSYADVRCSMSEHFIHCFAFPYNEGRNAMGLESLRIDVHSKPHASTAAALHQWDIRRLVQTTTKGGYNKSWLNPLNMQRALSPITNSHSQCGITDGYQYAIIGDACTSTNCMGSVALYDLHTMSCINRWELQCVASPSLVSVWTPPVCVKPWGEEVDVCIDELKIDVPNSSEAAYLMVGDSEGRLELIGFSKQK